MNSKRRSGTCCGLFDTRMGATIILSIELTFASLLILCQIALINEPLEFNSDAHAFIEITCSFSCFIFIANLAGLIGISKIKPNFLMLTIILRTMVIVMALLILIKVSFSYGTLNALIPFLLPLWWSTYSTIVLNQCLKELHDLNTDGPAIAKPHNHFPAEKV